MKYKVTVNLPSEITATQRVRAGVVVDRVAGYEGELTAEQLEAIQADSALVVEELAPAKPAKTAKKAAKPKTAKPSAK